jgi:Fur family transcriptional regulator, ferric uptake regulator
MNSIDILKQNKIKVTAPRKVILDIILNLNKSSSAEDIFKQCVNSAENINLSTVYRTLEIFEKKKLIDKFHLGDGKYSYTYKKDTHKHVLECSLCHMEIEVECPMKQIEELIKNKTGFTMMEHQLYIRGICDDCKKEEE